ncbi:YcnI family protein [Nocardioides litoris]|uniref:YcnI family copper-binding membrane protein n=1 Tax=Nocardioides litoris TaxID=1926648 RepID=UPI00111D2E22|nr:YcnI family protein [Nocardioides litoris]
MSRRTIARLGASAGAAGLLALSIAAPASAHVTVSPSTTAAGAYTVLTFSNGHGCEGSPTTKITISVPEGINAAVPTRQPFYDVTKQMEQLDPPVSDGHGGELTERVDTVTYTAKTALPDGYRDAFEVQVQIPEDAEGADLAFPVIQTCQQGETAWTEIPAEGQSADDLDSPAPAFLVTAADGEGGHSDEESTTTDESGEEVSTETGSNAIADTGADTQEAAASDGGGNALGITGVVVGVLGLAVAGVALARTRRTS